MYAAWMRPAMSDSFTSGQPLYLLYSNCPARAAQATGKVRLQVTGKPPTTRGPRAARALEDSGFLVGPIRPPTVPEGQARLRVTLSALHSEAQVDALIRALARVCAPAATVAAPAPATVS